jgi:hypothetical protein
MNEDARALIEAIHREAQQRPGASATPAAPPRAIHHTELPEAKAGEALAEEWNTYRREVGRLLEQGHEGKFVLIKGQQIIDLHDSWESAREAGLERYLLEPFFVHVVRAEEPALRIRGYNLPCRS